MVEEMPKYLAKYLREDEKQIWREAHGSDYNDEWSVVSRKRVDRILQSLAALREYVQKQEKHHLYKYRHLT